MTCCLRALLLFSAVLGTFLAQAAAAETPRPPNVLFIAVDDLRPQMACYGQAQMITPNLDRLAESGTIFERSYCMVATCGASRASLMTSLRPAPNRFTNFQTWAERDAPGIVTLNTHFKANGYYTVSNGKVFHNPEDNGQGWSEPAWRPPANSVGYALAENNRQMANPSSSGPGRRGPATEAADAPDQQYPDGQVLAKSLADLERLAAGQPPFFLAVGFFKPHRPFVAPKKYWDLYDREQIHLPSNYHVPRDAPSVAIHTSGELRSYSDIPAAGPVSDDKARELIHGYYACVSFTDANVGKLLDALDRLGLRDNTIVVLWGDHGWNLGEHTLWCKHSCFETSLHAPLLVRAPALRGGQRTRGLVEFIDIYPSLCELAGLPLPEHVQGTSFVPLLRDPGRCWKPAAISRFSNGDSIRTDQYRFTEYTARDGAAVARMLYDHASDPREDVNIAEHADRADAVNQLADQLRAGKGKNSPRPARGVQP